MRNRAWPRPPADPSDLCGPNRVLRRDYLISICLSGPEATRATPLPYDHIAHDYLAKGE